MGTKLASEFPTLLSDRLANLQLAVTVCSPAEAADQSSPGTVTKSRAYFGIVGR